MRKQSKGMTLIEMIVTIVILSIIVMMAFPSYMGYLRKTRRTDATVSLLDLASRMERYYAENNNSYASANITGNLGLSSATTSQGYYTLSIASSSASAYTLQATPVTGTSQANDSTCDNFTLTQTGQRGISGTGSVNECWGN